MGTRELKVEQTTNANKKKLMVAAIDFGTTYSGWAYSFYHAFKTNPTKILCKNWNSGKHLSTKAPTTVLIKSDGCTVEAFGYEAEERYAELVDEGEHLAYYYFEHFKMMLFDKKNLSRKEELEDDKGKRLPAKRVFSMVIKYLKDDLLEDSRKRPNSVGEDDIQWVLTVPAIWNPLAKLFMRECAIEAGIRSSDLLIALEPEAASLYCKYLTIQKEKDGSELGDPSSIFKPGARYMVVDAGGGTIDIIVHEVSRNGQLKEIHKADGGNWGGISVDKAFFGFLTGIVSQNVMNRFKNESKDDFLELQREFEVKKRSMKPVMTSKLKVKIPVSLTDIYKTEKGETIMDRVKKDSALNGKIDFKTDKILIDCRLVQEMFSPSINNVVKHMQNILRENSTKGTNSILMVGGFSESAMLFNAVRSSFQTQHVLIPEDAGLSVLKGAVIFGHNQKDISARISPYTYGVAVNCNFDADIHSMERMLVTSTGTYKAVDCFAKLIEVGERLSPDTISKECLSAFPQEGKTSFLIRLFATEDSNPTFVDEHGCFKLGEVEVDCKTDYGTVGGALVYLKLGGTEFEVHAVHKSTGQIVTKTTFYFLD